MAEILNNSIIDTFIDQLRDVQTKPSAFQRVTNEIAYLLSYEALKTAKTGNKEIETWQGNYQAKSFPQHDIAIVPILRAGMGMTEGVRRLLPGAQVHVLGMYRNEETLEPVWYYDKIPKNHSIRQALVIDPMLATGGSMSATIQALKNKNCDDIAALCIIGAPEGVKKIETDHPDVKIYLASLDEKLNEKGYILPGLGDAGDRIFNTIE